MRKVECYHVCAVKKDIKFFRHYSMLGGGSAVTGDFNLTFSPGFCVNVCVYLDSWGRSEIQICIVHIEVPETLVYKDSDLRRRRLQGESRLSCNHRLEREREGSHTILKIKFNDISRTFQAKIPSNSTGRLYRSRQSERKSGHRWLTLAEWVVEVARRTLVALVTLETTPTHTVTRHQVTWPVQTARTWTLTGWMDTHTQKQQNTNQ